MREARNRAEEVPFTTARAGAKYKKQATRRLEESAEHPLSFLRCRLLSRLCL